MTKMQWKMISAMIPAMMGRLQQASDTEEKVKSNLSVDLEVTPKASTEEEE